MDHNVNKTDIGNKIRELRNLKGLTQEELMGPLAGGMGGLF